MGCIDYVPFLVWPIQFPVNSVANGFQVDLAGVISPGSKFEDALLFIKWEILNIYFTGTLVNCWWKPVDGTVSMYQSHGSFPHVVWPVNTEMKWHHRINISNSSLRPVIILTLLNGKEKPLFWFRHSNMYVSRIETLSINIIHVAHIQYIPPGPLIHNYIHYVCLIDVDEH